MNNIHLYQPSIVVSMALFQGQQKQNKISLP